MRWVCIELHVWGEILLINAVGGEGWCVFSDLEMGLSRTEV